MIDQTALLHRLPRHDCHHHHFHRCCCCCGMMMNNSTRFTLHLTMVKNDRFRVRKHSFPIQGNQFKLILMMTRILIWIVFSFFTFGHRRCCIAITVCFLTFLALFLFKFLFLFLFFQFTVLVLLLFSAALLL